MARVLNQRRKKAAGSAFTNGHKMRFRMRNLLHIIIDILYFLCILVVLS